MKKVFEGYTITSPYGYRVDPITKARTFHQGIDLVIKHGSPIAAFVGGEIIHASEGESGTGLGGYGNVVVIKVSDGTCHLYAHLDSIKVKNGQTVEQGDIIGTQGNSGRSVGSHLHYEVRKTYKPLFGYNADKEAGTLEPTKYLEQLLGHAKPASKPAIKPVVKAAAKKEPNPKLVGRTYTTKQADVVADLTRAYGLTLAELQALNPKVNFAKLTSGTVIELG